jgi:hypothetical protein
MGSVPVMAFMVVVLPAPLEPMRRDQLALAHLEVDALDGLDAAVGHLAGRVTLSNGVVVMRPSGGQCAAVPR